MKYTKKTWEESVTTPHPTAEIFFLNTPFIEDAWINEDRKERRPKMKEGSCSRIPSITWQVSLEGLLLNQQGVYVQKC